VGDPRITCPRPTAFNANADAVSTISTSGAVESLSYHAIDHHLSRLEPRTSGTHIDIGYAARVHDPLWLLARQWQVGEFQGEDAGTQSWRAGVAG
jgi:hypothetical protein